MRTHRSITIIGATLLVSAVGSASGETVCGYAPAGWSAPNGAYVGNRGEGTISAVVSTMGEYRTHSMMSHAAGGFVTHETMKQPEQTGWPTVCSTPLNHDQLRYGYPGASQTPQGGIYSFLYGDGGLEFISYQVTKTNGTPTTLGAEIANFMWSTLPYWATSFGYRVGAMKWNGSAWEADPAGGPLNYSLYQYRDLWNVNQGWVGHNWGMVCSSLMAYSHYVNGKGTVSTPTYTHEKTVAAGNALYSAVEAGCNNSLGFWDKALSSIACLEGVCDDAARQVRNCMAANACNSDDESHWNNVANDANTTSNGLSPDRLGGWSGHPWSGYPSSQVSAWAYDGNNSLYWNSGGSVYGCWST